MELKNAAYPSVRPSNTALDDAHFRQRVLNLYQVHTARCVVAVLNEDGFSITLPMLNKLLSKWNAAKKSNYPKTRRQRRNEAMSDLARVHALELHIAPPSRQPDTPSNSQQLHKMLAALGNWYDNELDTTYQYGDIPTHASHEIGAILGRFHSALSCVTYHPGPTAWNALKACGTQSTSLFINKDLWMPLEVFQTLLSWRGDRWTPLVQAVEDLFSKQSAHILGTNHPVSMMIASVRDCEYNDLITDHVFALIASRLRARVSRYEAWEITMELRYMLARLLLYQKSYARAESLLYDLTVEAGLEICVNSLTLLAVIHARLGRLSDATHLVSQAHLVLLQDRGLHVQKSWRILQQRGFYHLKFGDFEDAENDLKHALQGIEENFEDTGFLCASYLHNALENQGKFDEADELGKRYSELMN